MGRPMARYVLSHKQAGVSDAGARRTGRERASAGFSRLFEAGADIIGITAPSAKSRREVIVFDASPSEIVAKSRQLPPDVMLEPEILHFPMRTQPEFGARRGAVDPAKGLGSGEVFEVVVTGAGVPLAEVVAELTLRRGGRVHTLVEATDPAGWARFEFGREWRPVALVAIPRAAHWPMLVVAPTSPAAIDAPRLPEG